MLINIFDKLPNGKIEHLDKQKYIEACNNLKPRRYIQTIEPYYPKRSTQQNKAMHGIPYKLIALALTESWGKKVLELEAKDICKINCLPDAVKQKQIDSFNLLIEQLVNSGAKVFPEFRLTTTTLTTSENNEYYANIQLWAGEYLGIEIPDPDPNKKT